MPAAHEAAIKERKKLFVPAAAPFYAALAPSGFTLIRVALSLILVPHGFAKLFQNDAVPTSRNFVHFGWSHPLVWLMRSAYLNFSAG